MNNRYPVKHILSIGMLVGVTLFAPTINATDYTYTQLNAPNATQGTVAYNINALGQVVGVYYNNQGSHGFIYNGKDYLTLDVPTATGGTFAYGINAKGQVVGNFIDNTGKHGFVYTDGNYATLDNPNGFDTNATGINDQGQVVGNFRIGTTGVYGFLYDPSKNTYTTLNHPKASAGNTSATNINNLGEVSGFIYNTGAHGFGYDGRLLAAINAPKAALAGTFTYGLNDTGQMVGVYYDSKSLGISYVYDGYNYQPLTPPNAKTSFANGINNQGQVVGYMTDNTGSHGFLATPSVDNSIATQLAFRHLLPSYKADETLTITVQEQLLVRKQALDLWVAVMSPTGELQYFNADAPGGLSSSPKPFKAAVSADTVRHTVFSFVVPKGLVGRYTLYALFNNPGSDLSNLTQSLKSNIAKAEVELK